MGNEPAGCIGFLLHLFGIGKQADSSGANSGPLPYRRRDDFLSAAELRFFQALTQAVGQQFHVCAKVRIGDLLYVANRNQNMSHANKIERKHVDFVLCDPSSMQAKLAIELDDSSHQRADRQARDQLVDAAFAAANFPILHVACRGEYQQENLKLQIRAALNPVPPAVSNGPPSLHQPDASHAPICPKCNVPMVQRTASRGKQSGKRFWGCPSYPDCRNVVAID